MNNSYSERALKFKPLTSDWENHVPQVCPSRNAGQTSIWQTNELEGDELNSFIERHSAIHAYGQKILQGIHRDFSDQNDLLVLTDAQGRLITLYSSSNILLHITSNGMLFRPGVLLNESSCGSNAILLALRYYETMISTRAGTESAPFKNCATVAVPLLESNQKPLACIALFNGCEGSLGEKLLLTKFVARAFSQFFDSAIMNEIEPNLGAATRVGTVVSDTPNYGATAAPSRTGVEDRRRGDRRQNLPMAWPERMDIKLTPRQHQVLMLFAQGKGYKTIAREIGITSYKTVEEHLDAVREKLNVLSRRECIQKAISLGLI